MNTSQNQLTIWIGREGVDVEAEPCHGPLHDCRKIRHRSYLDIVCIALHDSYGNAGGLESGCLVGGCRMRLEGANELFPVRRLRCLRSVEIGSIQGCLDRVSFDGLYRVGYRNDGDRRATRHRALDYSGDKISGSKWPSGVVYQD